MNSEGAAFPQDESRKLMNRLRQETKAYHAKLESLPYFIALTDHRLPVECYVNQLRALSVIHGVFENEIAASHHSLVMAIWDEGLRKLPLLEADLKLFNPRFMPDANLSIQYALSITEKIRIRQIENPVTLIGYLYVLEGSTLGNSMHRPDITAAYHLDESSGCSYYSSYGPDVRTHWNHFSQKVNHILDDPALHDPIIQAAHEAFFGLESLYMALFPLQEKARSYHITRINPEAGNHPIPEDEREIQAALAASERAWQEFPYYEYRYGRRGKRFSDSDFCWLATLMALDRESLEKQVDWLCRVLAARGMPSIMMEHSLRYLYDELSAAVPDKSAACEMLRDAADVLKSKRETYFSNTALQLLSDEFEAAVGCEMAKAYANTGKLLVAAIADEKNGINGTLGALQEWLTDTKRFSDDWISTVNETIKKAHQAVS